MCDYIDIYSQQDPLAKLITRKVIVNDIQVFNHKLTTELKSESFAQRTTAEVQPDY